MTKYAIFCILIHPHIYALFCIFMHLDIYALFCIFIQVDIFGAAAPVQSQQSMHLSGEIKLYTIWYKMASLLDSRRRRHRASAKSTINAPQRGNKVVHNLVQNGKSS